jgi:large subunit ribosomal protein L10
MATPNKVAAVEEITTDFKESNAAVLTEYRGLTVAQLKELRVSLGLETKFSVVKNTLTGIAAKEAGIDAFDDQLSGPTAIAFIKGDAVAAAKSLTDFAKSNPQLVIKTGFFEGKALDAPGVAALAGVKRAIGRRRFSSQRIEPDCGCRRTSVQLPSQKRRTPGFGICAELVSMQVSEIT